MNNVNPPPSLSIIRPKDLGSKLQGVALYKKLISIDNNALLPVLAERTKYWFIVPVAGLQMRIFAIDTREGYNFATTEVTHEYFKKNAYQLDIHYHRHYTMCKIQFTSRARSLVIVWFNEAHFYTDLFFVKEAAQNIPLPYVLHQIYQQLGVAVPPVAPNNNLMHDEEQYDMEIDGVANNTNVTPVIGQPVVYTNGLPERFQRIVTIIVTELARKWTWEAFVLEHPEIRFDELYMRGGQACNSVILRCKQRMYELYPEDEIHFELKQRPRRKDALKRQGQKFLNAVMGSWWSSQPGSAIVDEPSNVNPEPITQNSATPVHVTDDNTVVIMVFELEYPESSEQACWIAQVCDDNKQLAIELRSEHQTISDRARLIDEMKARVRARLQRNDITFNEDIQVKKPDRLRAWAYWWLGVATTRAVSFANWAGSVINFFSGNNNNNNNNNNNIDNNNTQQQ